MSVTFQDYINELIKGKLIRRAKIEWMRREDESVISEFSADILSGTLTINRQNGVRRSVNLTLKNIDGKYLPSETGQIWIRQKFRLSLGLNINGEDFFIPQGVFVISDPETVSNCSDKTVSIAGIDKFSLLDGQLGGDLDGVYQIPVGTNIYSALQSILVLAEDKLPCIFQSDLTSIISPYTIKKEPGSNLGEILTELAGMLSCNIYYNEVGNLVFAKDVSDTIKGSQWDFTTDEFQYLGATNKYNFSKVFNIVKIIGSNIDGTSLSASSINDNLQSNTRWQLIGKRTKVITDDVINTVDLAQQRADYELKRVIAVQSSINIKSIPMFHCDVDNIITLTDSSLGLDKERFLINQLTLPLDTAGELSISCVKSKELDF